MTRNSSNGLTALLAASLALGAATIAQAGTLSGTVVGDDGRAIAGAIVTLTDKRGVSESVYSNDKGEFRLATELQGELKFWVRKRYYRDDTRELELPAAAKTQVKVMLAALTDARALSDDHPSLSFFCARRGQDAREAARRGVGQDGPAHARLSR